MKRKTENSKFLKEMFINHKRVHYCAQALGRFRDLVEELDPVDEEFTDLCGECEQQYDSAAELLSCISLAQHQTLFRLANIHLAGNRGVDPVVHIAPGFWPSWHEAVFFHAIQVAAVIQYRAGPPFDGSDVSSAATEMTSLQAALRSGQIKELPHFLPGLNLEETVARLQLEFAQAQYLAVQNSRSPLADDTTIEYEIAVASAGKSARQERDAWIYEQLLDVNKRLWEVLGELRSICQRRGWPDTISRVQGLQQAAQRYSLKFGMPPLPPRKDDEELLNPVELN